MSESNVVTIAGKEYEESNLDDKQMYLINQIRDLQAKAANLRFQLDQVHKIFSEIFSGSKDR